MLKQVDLTFVQGTKNDIFILRKAEDVFSLCNKDKEIMVDNAFFEESEPSESERWFFEFGSIPRIVYIEKTKNINTFVSLFLCHTMYKKLEPKFKFNRILLQSFNDLIHFKLNFVNPKFYHPFKNASSKEEVFEIFESFDLGEHCELYFCKIYYPKFYLLDDEKCNNEDKESLCLKMCKGLHCFDIDYLLIDDPIYYNEVQTYSKEAFRRVFTS